MLGFLLHMNSPVEKCDGRLMRQMFGTIAPRYDFVTHVFSYGMDRRWKRFAVQKASLSNGAMVLDLACGTDDFSQIVLQSLSGARVVAVDLTEQMLDVARRRSPTEVVCADAVALPFADRLFDCVFVGYGLRNFPNLNTALGEIHRVTRPGRPVGESGFLPARQPALAQALSRIFIRPGCFLGLAAARTCRPVHIHS
jgi:demethylmenaquinone methyltransferase/2-methoxy-6-polyprenyl-1,4-benzoquinol methylase